MTRILAVFILAVLMSCTAQKQGLKSFHLAMLQEADLLYIQEDYHGASAIYDRILEANPAHPLSNLRTGICRLNMRNFQTTALKYLERAKEQNLPEASYYIGLALHFQERFDDAESAMENYLASDDQAIPEPLVRKQMEMIRRAREAYGSPRNHHLENLGEAINSPYPDYVPLISADGTQLYFTSRRAGGMTDQHDPNGDFFEDVYAAKKQNGEWTRAENLGTPINTETHDATVALSPSGNRMLVYRTSPALEGGDIFSTELGRNGWSEPEKFTDRVNSRFFEPSATIESDERTIYFASNRPGGYGGKDIYRVVELPDGSWSHPINLGPRINTPEHEDGPFISADGSELYFSSTGHNSIGGYDLYKATYLADFSEWGEPESLGHPVNTVFDDIYLVMEASGNVGYYSTNRMGGHGDHDIYQVSFGAENPLILVSGTVTDELDRPLRADIQTTEKQSGESKRYQSNAKSGKYVLVLKPGEAYNVEVSGLDVETLTLEMQYEEELGARVTEVNEDIQLKHLNQQSLHE